MSNTQSDQDFDFAEWLTDISHGTTNQRAGQLLRELVTACAETGAKGKLVLTFNVAVDDGRAEVKPDIKVTKPGKKLPGAHFFATDEGALVTQDPRQLSLPVKTLGVTPIKGGNAS